MITIVDYGVGNLASLQNMLRKIGIPSIISSDDTAIRQASKIILPGVGAFDTCVQKLQGSGLLPGLNKRVLEDKIPVLGVCVGMQLLTENSEEGILPGLGWIKGKIVRFKEEKLPVGFKIPHMGWTEIAVSKPSKLLEGMYEEARFYFVHSYYAELNSSSDVLLEAKYGYIFTAGIERGNILGVQFHPEKSHKFGMKLLSNFAINY